MNPWSPHTRRSSSSSWTAKLLAGGLMLLGAMGCENPDAYIKVWSTEGGSIVLEKHRAQGDDAWCQIWQDENHEMTDDCGVNATVEMPNGRTYSVVTRAIPNPRQLTWTLYGQPDPGYTFVGWSGCIAENRASLIDDPTSACEIVGPNTLFATYTYHLLLASSLDNGDIVAFFEPDESQAE